MGGLEDDELVKKAKEFFSEQGESAMKETIANIDRASPEQRKAIAKEIREQHPGSESLDDDALVQMFKTAQSSSSCEIHAMVVPTPTNDCVGVSLYSASNTSPNVVVNDRAVALMRACGHAIATDGVRGDVFLGRYRDDERRDVWERLDFSAPEANPGAEWCRRARRAGGGGGTGGGKAAPSLSGTVQQTTTGVSGGGAAGAGEKMDSVDDNDNNDNALPYQWSQTNEEIELRMAVDADTKAKFIKVSFARTTLRVVVAGQTLIDGETGGDVSVDDSTYTIEQTKDDDKKELTVTLAKKQEGLTWNYAVLSSKD